MDLSLQKRLAAEVLGVGEDRIWIDPKKADEVSKALTREDIRKLINEKVIKVKVISGQSRYWSNVLHQQRKKGRRRGYGSRKGKKSARMGEKEEYVTKVRSMRNLIRTLKSKGIIDKHIYRNLYNLIKGGAFKSKRHILLWLKEKRIIK
ncbi:MAG: 50S ribosomal protein L19e [Candidatus Nanoclepta minutus]|uniref:Large ribosomal subunit protein eL19 n=1 Tax=Candidatus Nanoclepta minutus TaxID=1940235 RepID=A0A397WNM5_9ARCH|nr:MAG: 50S ribosomal protein L19e [Candidatus Nanoclepta minutus]